MYKLMYIFSCALLTIEHTVLLYIEYLNVQYILLFFVDITQIHFIFLYICTYYCIYACFLHIMQFFVYISCCIKHLIQLCLTITSNISYLYVIIVCLSIYHINYIVHFDEGAVLYIFIVYVHVHFVCFVLCAMLRACYNYGRVQRVHLCVLLCVHVVSVGL